MNRVYCIAREEGRRFKEQEWDISSVNKSAMYQHKRDWKYLEYMWEHKVEPGSMFTCGSQ